MDIGHSSTNTYSCVPSGVTCKTTKTSSTTTCCSTISNCYTGSVKIGLISKGRALDIGGKVRLAELLKDYKDSL